MEPLVIAPDTVVTLSYVLFDEQGEAVDRATDAEPLTYVHGYAQIVPGLEKRLEGLKAGDAQSFSLEADEAFGERDDDGILEVDKSDFPDAGEVVEGDEFMAQGPDGEPIAMRVVEVRDDAFVVDTNHPLAGQKVRFDVQVSSVRAATDEEIAEAEADLEERADDADDGCCGHDHDGDDHDHDHAAAPSLVQLSKKTVS
jgi:FKBP-type peptidyl-prolyl cis-trans isomerase SlyD